MSSADLILINSLEESVKALKQLNERLKWLSKVNNGDT